MSKKAQQMVARYGRNLSVIEIYEKILKEKEKLAERYRYVAFPRKAKAGEIGYEDKKLIYTDYPIITAAPEIQVFTWGLIPFWTKNMEQASMLRVKEYNARSETLFEKNSYREPIKRSRGIIPATGYFEYHTNADGSKTPYYIHVISEEIFSIACIYEHWKNPATGEEFNTFSLITTEANPKIAEIHNGGEHAHRMPCILTREQEKIWLLNDLTENEIKDTLQIYPGDDMDAYAISKDYLKKSPYDGTIIERAA